jgi:3-oxoacyl-[acyl-carrier protein] reductase
MTGTGEQGVEMSGAVALVTGGSGDLGRAIALSLARSGASVAITYTAEQERARRTADEIEAEGQEALVLQLDQANPDEAVEVVDAVVERFGRLDILVNNAAWNIGIPFADLDALTSEVWDRIQGTNLRGPFLLARAAAGPMREQQRGRIVNIASVGGVYPNSSSIAYSVSKAGLIHLTRCLAVAMAPHVLVNCVAPGLMEGTRMASRLPPEVVDFVKRTVLLGRAADPADVADQVLTFCRTESTTGQVIVVDSGIFPR